MRGSENVVLRWPFHLLSFGVAILDPLHSHALIVLVQGGDHCLVDPSCRRGKDAEMLRPGPSSTGMLCRPVRLALVHTHTHTESCSICMGADMLTDKIKPRKRDLVRSGHH